MNTAFLRVVSPFPSSFILKVCLWKLWIPLKMTNIMIKHWTLGGIFPLFFEENHLPRVVVGLLQILGAVSRVLTRWNRPDRSRRPGALELFCRAADLLEASLLSPSEKKTLLGGPGEKPLWKIGVRPLGWWMTPKINGKMPNSWQPNHQPAESCQGMVTCRGVVSHQAM